MSHDSESEKLTEPESHEQDDHDLPYDPQPLTPPAPDASSKEPVAQQLPEYERAAKDGHGTHSAYPRPNRRPTPWTEHSSGTNWLRTTSYAIVGFIMSVLLMVSCASMAPKPSPVEPANPSGTSTTSRGAGENGPSGGS